MSQEKSKAIFNQVHADFRADLANIKKLQEVMLAKVGETIPDEDTRNWLLDVYIDKFFEIDVKLKKIAKEMGGVSTSNFWSSIRHIKEMTHEMAFAQNVTTFIAYRNSTTDSINTAIKYAEEVFTEIREKMWGSDWAGLEKVKPLEYVTTERKRYVSAFDELQKARDCLNGKIEDVTLHLRPAINQALLERFRFKKIHPMSRFIDDAKKLNFPLPSYDFIYEIYDEGSDRLHAGKPPTSWEAHQMIKTVSSFIDALDLIEISDEDIDDFKKKSSTVN